MTLWLVRAGKYGEHENRFLSEDCVCLTWEGLEESDLSTSPEHAAIKKLVRTKYESESPRKLSIWAGQIGAFVLDMKPGDWVVLPRKTQGSIAVGEIVGPYKFDAASDPIYRHRRAIRWLNREVPRAAFDQDLLYSFGACLTICEVRRNDAEKRVHAMATNQWRSTPSRGTSLKMPQRVSDVALANEDELIDLGQLGRDQIAKIIERQFKGHALARLVAAILEAQGYATHVSPAGPDKGVDILAAPDPLGFGSPRICVQVKSGDEPVDRPTLDQLIGVMQNVGAQQGLMVSWAGFKTSVERETASQFFRVRLWDADALVEQLLEQYDRLAPDIRAEVPLKRVWTVATQEDAA